MTVDEHSSIQTCLLLSVDWKNDDDKLVDDRQHTCELAPYGRCAARNSSCFFSFSLSLAVCLILCNRWVAVWWITIVSRSASSSIWASIARENVTSFHRDNKFKLTNHLSSRPSICLSSATISSVICGHRKQIDSRTGQVVLCRALIQSLLLPYVCVCLSRARWLYH